MRRRPLRQVHHDGFIDDAARSAGEKVSELWLMGAAAVGLLIGA